jgi:hypothetical protein
MKKVWQTHPLITKAKNVSTLNWVLCRCFLQLYILEFVPRKIWQPCATATADDTTEKLVFNVKVVY